MISKYANKICIQLHQSINFPIPKNFWYIRDRSLL
ncbi:hypothetical protein SPLC1_S081770 [Arthrospira platensis C1]|nr:hypothetical protein SPLC1_S081770 [Arthrospira platensis C1]